MHLFKRIIQKASDIFCFSANDIASVAYVSNRNTSLDRLLDPTVWVKCLFVLELFSVCVSVCVYLCIYVSVCMFMCICVCVCLCLREYVCVGVNVCVREYMCA